MKKVWLSLFLVTTFAIACSSSEATENKTEEGETSTRQITSNRPKSEGVTRATTSTEEMVSNTTELENSASNLEPISAAETKSNSEPIIKTTETVRAATKDISVAETSNSSQENKELSKPVVKPLKPVKMVLIHDIFDALLRKYVNSTGSVDYVGLQKDKAKLTEYLAVLKSNPPQSSWSKNKEMAYWINLYNAFTMDAIVEKYPISSVMNLEEGKLWDRKKIVIAGESLSLNNIEKDKLLKRFKEPRVHFAVNCGAISCPPLLNKAWTEDNIQAYYDKQVKAFINNPKHNTISLKNLEASQIFNWYAGDFGGSDKVVAYFQKYSKTELEDNPKVRYREYNWKLNKQ